jgi:hypothetical protein
VGMENDWMYGGGTPPMSDPASLSRRDVFGALAGGAALLAGSAAVADAQHANSTAGQKGMVAGRKYRAYVRTADSASVQVLTLRGGPLPPGRVLVRTEAAQCCYTISIQALGNAEQNAYLRLGERFTVPTILGHGGVGIVEAVGPLVTRVRVGGSRTDAWAEERQRRRPREPLRQVAQGWEAVAFHTMYRLRIQPMEHRSYSSD